MIDPSTEVTPELCLRDDSLIVHAAGPQLTFANRSRQRCMWCGILIEDKYWPEIEVPVPEGKTQEQANLEAENGCWQMGTWIVIDLDGLKFATPQTGDEPPPGSCLYFPADSEPTWGLFLGEPLDRNPYMQVKACGRTPKRKKWWQR